MDENTKNIIKETFNGLPESIRDLLMSSEFQNSLLEIGQKYALSVEQVSALDLETTLILMGLNPLKDFEEEVKKALGIDAIKSLEIVTDINEKIFLSVHHLLQLMNTPEGADPMVDEELISAITPTRQVELPATQIHTTKTLTDTQVLSSAGIEIVPNTVQKPVTELPVVEKRLDILSKVEKPDDVVKTIPTNIPPTAPTAPAPTISSIPALTHTPPTTTASAVQPSIAPVYTPPHTAPISSPAPVSKTDPYRMPIE